MTSPVIAVHGGCWSPPRDARRDTSAAERALADAVDAAAAALGQGGSPLDAVVAAVELLEDAEPFNAGRGSVLTSDGTVEMDAAVMTGDGRAGAVAAATSVRHPVALARAVMETTPHVLLAGAGAERIAPELERMPPEWFITTRRREASKGTVGAVVRDADGNLAAATSTGGTPGQLPGRVGDSPLIGAGTWADGTVAISCTGAGEAIIRNAAAHRVAMLVESGVPLTQAAAQLVQSVEDDCGLIAVDASGNLTLPFNTTLMNRGWQEDGKTTTAVWAADAASGTQ